MKRKKQLYIMILLFLFLFQSLLLSGCAKKQEAYTASGIYFDTFISISVYDIADRAYADECIKMAYRYENLFSRKVEGSDIDRINHAHGNPVEVDPETAALLSTAIEYAELTDGLVDPTVAPITSLWKFNIETPNAPNAEILKENASHVNYKNVEINDNTVTMLDPIGGIDLGFIAKGYIADKMGQYLRSQNVTSALINLGGNVLTVGCKPDGSDFVVGVKKPFSMENETMMSLNINNTSVVSSGIYERYFYEEGNFYHHILDTKTGYPVENSLLGVTLIGPDSTKCDALSTAVFIMGPEKGLQFVEETPDLEAVFVTDDYQLIKSSGLGSEN